MFRRISPSALAMFLVVVLTLTTGIVFGAADRTPPDRGVQLAEALPDPAVDPTPEPTTPPREAAAEQAGPDAEPARAKRPEPPPSPRSASGGSARPAVATEPDPVRDLSEQAIAAAAADFQLAPIDFAEATGAAPGAEPDLDAQVLALEFSAAGSSSSGTAEPDSAPMPTPVAPAPAPTPSVVGPDATELVYPVGMAGDLTVAYDPRGIVEIADVQPAPGWEVRNRAAWRKGVKVLFTSTTEPGTEATIYVQIVERQPVVTVTLPAIMPPG